MTRRFASRARFADALRLVRRPAPLLIAWVLPSLPGPATEPVRLPNLTTAATPVVSEPLSRITASDNRVRAGRLEGGVLTVRLDARDGMWYPEGPNGVGLPVAAFAEEGKGLQNPGPLIRVPVGTEVRVTLHNSLAKPLTVFGLGQQRGISGDSVIVQAGEVRDVRFRATAAGIYYYAGRTSPSGRVLGRGAADSQLNGAIVVDPADAGVTPNDRVFMISAAKGDGVEDLLSYCVAHVPQGPWLYPADQAADIPSRLLAAEITREKIYLRLHDELPYASAVVTESWKDQKDGSVRIDQTIYVEREGQKGIVVGKGGQTIKAIGEAARLELEKMFGRRVHLFLHSKVSERWGESREHYQEWGLEFPKDQ